MDSTEKIKIIFTKETYKEASAMNKSINATREKPNVTLEISKERATCEMLCMISRLIIFMWGLRNVMTYGAVLEF